MKYFLTIAASDNSGGAGIQQDIKVAWDLGYWPLSVITGITVQNFTRARIIQPVEDELVREQMTESLSSFPVQAVKIGALTSEENVIAVARVLERFRPSVVVLDTVIATSSGKAFLSSEAVEVMKQQLFPLTTVITPNKPEFEILTGQKFNDFSSAVEVAREFSARWNTAVILKGGHFGGETVPEAVVTPASTQVFHWSRLDFSRYSHGTGCTFSSALACSLGDGYDLATAYQRATDYLRNFYSRMQREI